MSIVHPSDLARGFADLRVRMHTHLQCRTLDQAIDVCTEALAEANTRFNPERFRRDARYGDGSYPPQGARDT